jgi:XRE family transcriptional regulator, regulator of sulfur utilization
LDKHTLATLGRHLQSLRLASGLSLSQLATEAGIAKSNLSRLEQGQGNPTLDTIWRLAIRLNVPFGNLVSPISVPLGDEKVQVRLIDQGKDNPQVDAYWMSLAPHTLREAEAHSAGTSEFITVISGQLSVGTPGNTKLLTAGQSHHFGADQPHRYQTTDTGATAQLTIVYASAGAQP